ncbi:uncharacterized protein LOC125353781 [Perognathus longimembris pacificus]|uniref:uncharacterized protein LOC125353781 n=1 Tax=Perognathus longimembris pacificus TaxID=214514 RepID=UPI0020186980|nr:uncharacterized protein LOC125353781 [Perognathus longimembris pacificus]
MPIGDSLQEQPGVLGGPQVRVLHQAEEQQMAAAIQLCLGQRRAEELSHARMQEQDAGGASSGPSSSRRARPLRLRAPPGGATGLPGAAEQVTGAEVTSAHPPESPAFPRLLRPTTPALGFLGEKPQVPGCWGSRAPHPPAAAAAGPPSPPSPPPACGSVACGALCPCEHAHPGLPFCSTLTSSSRSGVQELPAAAARVQVRTPLELGHPHPCICDWLREGAAGAGRRCSISRGAETLHSRRPPARPGPPQPRQTYRLRWGCACRPDGCRISSSHPQDRGAEHPATILVLGAGIPRACWWKAAAVQRLMSRRALVLCPLCWSEGRRALDPAVWLLPRVLAAGALGSGRLRPVSVAAGRC